ncbi:divergent polysaccharide deacetylase family protein [Chitinispirillales bacterium ANBcel5]|uniref:divergent polysaccharide deacetylase family protein n=1 Tax=Cellulosispirillum alkaliphilum TaxID=3039283 RepID=UPI002A544B62|nr:divergent polysaccharide deacetylase family protein [Chitinispirillales bacterium ANBcel5]
MSKKTYDYRPLLIGASVLAVALFLIIGSRNKALESSKGDKLAFESQGNIKNNLKRLFEIMELRESDFSFDSSKINIEVQASVPRGRPIEWVVWKLSKAVDATNYKVADSFLRSNNRSTITFKSTKPNEPDIKLLVSRSSRFLSNTSKFAILIYNFGFEADKTTVEYLSFPEPLTIALLPHERLAPWTAQIANEYNKEVVVLVPMEELPRSYSRYNDAAIMVHHDENEIKNLLSQAVGSLPDFSGVGNFHGNRSMQNSRVVTTIMSEINNHDSYFIHINKSRFSKADSIAAYHNAQYTSVDGVIDPQDNAEQIRNKLLHYAVVSHNTGRFVLKAPPTSLFIDILNDQLPNLKSNGVKLVYVSELLM